MGGAPTLKTKSVKFNFMMNMILTVSSFVFPLITFPYVSRVLLVEGNGYVSFATSVLTYFTMFASLGIPSYGIRACAQVRDDRKELSRVTQELFIINIITTIVVSIVFVITLFTVPQFKEQQTLLWINGASLILNAVGVNWFYSAMEQYSYITVRSIIFKIASIILMFIFVRQQKDYIIYGAITVFATSGSNLLNFVNLRKFIDLKPVGNYRFKRHLKPILYFFAASAATSVYTNLDTVMLGFMNTQTEVGLYSAAVKLKTVLVTAVTSLGTVLLPRLSYYIVNKMEAQFRDMIVKSFNFVLIFAVPLCAYFILFARDSILLLSGEAFLGAVIPMQILMPTLVFIGFSNITGIQILVPDGKEKFLLISIAAGALLNLILNAIWIPYWGATGAAISTTIAEALVLGIQVWFLRKRLKPIWKKISFRHLFVGMIPALGAGFAIFYLVDLQPIFRLLISAFVFFGLYFIALFVQKEPFLTGTITSIKNKVLKRKPPVQTEEQEPKEEIFTDEALEKETEQKQIEKIVDEIVEEVEHNKTEEDNKK